MERGCCFLTLTETGINKHFLLHAPFGRWRTTETIRLPSRSPIFASDPPLAYFTTGKHRMSPCRCVKLFGLFV